MVADYGFSHAEDMVNTRKGQTDIPEAVAELQRIFDADIAEFGSDIPRQRCMTPTTFRAHPTPLGWSIRGGPRSGRPQRTVQSPECDAIPPYGGGSAALDALREGDDEKFPKRIAPLGPLEPPPARSAPS